ncbi:MAG TPA: hypothetical protein VNU68_35110 [Verrucomicrobiae bacterium]|nr:hypothetical protein [Verrucomicrobiae bacterium]
MYGETVGRMQPYVEAGGNALGELQRLLGIGAGGAGATSPLLQMLGYGGAGGTGAGNIDPRTFQGSPGYQYQLQQGTNAVTNSAHGNVGGNALRALQQTGQGLANQNFNQYLGNFSGAWGNLLGNLSNLAGSGQNAAANLGGIGTGVASQIGANTIGGGNALAAGQVGGANAITGGFGQAGTAIGSAFQNPQFQSWLKGLVSSGANDGSGTPSYISLDPTGQSIAPGFATG